MTEKDDHLIERAGLTAAHLGLDDDLLPHVEEHLGELLGGAAPVIWIQGQNCTGCTVTLLNSDHFNPSWIMGTLIELLLWVDEHKEAPVLDDKLRLKKFYESKIHDNCTRKQAFQEKRFLEDWNDCRPDEDRCLLKMGCKGPTTHADCPTREWNSATNWCVGVNAPCHGCTEPDFHNKLPHPK